MTALRVIEQYDGTQDSGIEWLGDIPAHWHLKRLKFVVDIEKRIAGKEGFDVLSITQKGIKVKDVESGEGQLAMDYSKYQFLYKGEFAMNHMDLLTGYVDISQYDGVVSPDYRVFRNRSSEVLDAYLLLIFQMGYTQRIFYKYGQGVSFLGRWRFPADNFNNFFIPIPSLEEQKFIVDFVLRKSKQIDEAIEIKEQEIALLKEREKIIIQKVVTQGINPNIPMKDSGVDWIGRIPEHWDFKPLTKEVFVQEGPGIMAVDFHEVGVPLIRISGVKSGTVSLEGCNYLKPSKVRQKWNHFKLKKNDLVISGSASTELVSEVTEEAEGAILYTGLIRVTPQRNSVMREYLKIFFGSKLFFTQIDLQKTGSTISHYGPSHLAKMFLLLPSQSDQADIVEFVKLRRQEIYQAIDFQQQQIEKLKEYRETLIHSAVTGKIKVA